MAKVTFIDHRGVERSVESPNGTSLMEVAKKNGVAGIDADCGGGCACGTCHVYVEPQWREVVGEAGAIEQAILEFSFEVRPNSRLSCQIKIRDELDGLVVRLPESQR